MSKNKDQDHEVLQVIDLIILGDTKYINYYYYYYITFFSIYKNILWKVGAKNWTQRLDQAEVQRLDYINGDR